ncbi:TetR family transcriptional regulator [Rhizocola hellebori]|uniref:TetR family transcriptional regulator n=1 Tax=Rhizocola hellebori TaxID=1392758 RepID=A0A8J3QKD8_9ACTN|nr:TetR/AcrR family transcriptional regulator [Rhizocola hellebori]GIH11242.1 TetR family transcriptional regulator [Rhizocola hellebori]
MADDTRSRIQAVALELFTEKGYDSTSLREIAEALGVTKAALYYHFKSKEEIVESLTGDHVARMEDLLSWAEEQPSTPEFRREFLTRYADSLNVSQHFKIMKFFQQNQPAVKNMPNAAKWRESLGRMITILIGPTADPVERMRVGLAVFGLHVSWMLLPENEFSEQERRNAAIAVAEGLIDQKS